MWSGVKYAALIMIPVTPDTDAMIAYLKGVLNGN
jgi:hypothetical protein